jgi:hypothetical protein
MAKLVGGNMSSFTLNGVAYTLDPVYAADTNIHVGWDLMANDQRITSFMAQSDMVLEGLAFEPILSESVALSTAIDFVSNKLGSLRERQELIERARAIPLTDETITALEDLPLEKINAIVTSLEQTNTAETNP